MKTRSKQASRRAFLKITSGAGCGLLLRGLATGLPPAWILNPSTAWAQDARDFQTLILSNSGRGDPVNINCPGSVKLDSNKNRFANNPHLNFPMFTLNGQRVRGAAPWAELPNDLRRRLAFIHLKTFAAAHPEHRETMTLRGAVRTAAGNGTEMLASMVAQETAGGIQTVQLEPIVLGRDSVTFNGQPLQKASPADLKALFQGDPNDLNRLRTLRDQTIDRIYRDLRQNGTASQRTFLDRFARSASEARQLGNELGDWVNQPVRDPDNPNSADEQVVAAVALAKARVAPVITVNIPFGGDNHQDVDLQNEAASTTSGAATIGLLWESLKAARIHNRVTFAMLNVFGREFQRNGAGGRNHNRHHGVMVIFGQKIKGGVYGGVTENGRCMNINPNSGRGIANGGIKADQTMVSAGKTLCTAIGIPARTLNARIQGGRIVRAALRS
ncbi:MAG: DUF1501 domain-containing protein [Myxococcota bacterium]|nr:DUF1501 domain-containing protein [Myxococcota bacterium]